MCVSQKTDENAAELPQIGHVRGMWGLFPSQGAPFHTPSTPLSLTHISLYPFPLWIPHYISNNPVDPYGPYITP